MVRRVIVIALMVLWCLAAQPAWAQNLLANPGFESFPIGTHYGDGAYTAYNWRYFSVSGAGGTLDAVTPGHQGNVAIRLTCSSTSGDSGLDKDGSLFVPVVEGRRYRATVWAKTESQGSLTITIAPYNSSKVWMGVQTWQTFGLTSSYRQYGVEYVMPPGTAYVNYALRVAQTGSVTVDDCELIDLTGQPPAAPRVTYPANEAVDSFSPVIAFAGAPHTAWQAIITSGSDTVWDSGEVSGNAYTAACPLALQPQSSYAVKVRMQNAAGWSGYSPTSAFTTPAAPLVRITSPPEADDLRGPTATLDWQAESPGGITAQTVSVDGGTPTAVDLAARTYQLSGLSEGLHTVSVAVTSAEGTASASSRFHVRITPAPAGTIYYYDMSWTLNYSRSNLAQRKLAYDIPMAVAALQGLVNRGGPRLFVKVFSEDGTWWNRLREPGNWLANKTVVTIPTGISNLHTLFETFRDDYQGAVVWDGNVGSTANVACTVAGADNLIPIRYDTDAGSVYTRLVTGGPKIPVQMNLVGKFTGAGTIPDTSLPSTGSKKVDSYVWARTKYLETGKCDPSVLMYAVDGYWLTGGWIMVGNPGHTLSCRDFVVMKKGFFFDLNVWADETPIDDPSQTLGLDLSELRAMLGAAAARTPGMVHAVGFVPWPMKYTNYTTPSGNAGGTHEPVATEWEYAKWLTYYNAYMDADAYNIVDFSSASIYTQFPLPDRLTQNPELSPVDLRKRGYLDTAGSVAPLNYLNIYMGDYDAACWLVKMAVSYWSDANRGSVPLSWAFNPNLIDRAAAVYEYYSRTRSANDSFVAGDCGAGYVNPSRLLTGRESGLPSARDIWVRHNLRYFRKTNVEISGFLINGTAGVIGPDVDIMYAEFSPGGTFSQPLWYPQGDHMVGSMPALLQRQDLTKNAVTDADIIQPMGCAGFPQFLNYRVVLATPTYVKNLLSNIVARDAIIPWALVDARTYAALVSCHLGKAPSSRATYTFDTLPRSVSAGATFAGSVGVRNDGWDTWSASGPNRIELSIKWMQGAQVLASTAVPLAGDVVSGSGAVLNVSWNAPAIPGTYTLVYEMTRGGTAFSALGDYAWESEVTAGPPEAGLTCAQAKALPDDALATVWRAVVTAGTDRLSGAFYVEDADRVSGIRVVPSAGSSVDAAEGDRVTVIGRLATQSGERVLLEPIVLPVADN